MPPMTHTVSRNHHLIFHSHKPPLHLTHTSHPSAGADWPLVASEGLDHGWTIVGFMCCCRLTHHTLCSPLGSTCSVLIFCTSMSWCQGKFLQLPGRGEDPSRRREQRWRSNEQHHEPAAGVRAVKMPLQRLFYAAPCWGPVESRAYSCKYKDASKRCAWWCRILKLPLCTCVPCLFSADCSSSGMRNPTQRQFFKVLP